MLIIKEISAMQHLVHQHRKQNRSIGFTPTMGALHNGHAALIQKSKAENDISVCSIFVNPIQFNNSEDLKKYPRPEQRDIEFLSNLQVDVLFLPSVQEMYPNAATLSFHFGALETIFEGAFRPGHFSGVALVVSKLFHIIQADVAYFGQKDFQQFLIVSELVNQTCMPIKLCCVPTVRESAGLAMSSRNQQLDALGKKKALFLYQSLTAAHDLLKKGKDMNEIRTLIFQQSKEAHIDVEYLELASQKNLKPLTKLEATIPSVLLIAATVEGVRLIDNVVVA